MHAYQLFLPVTAPRLALLAAAFLALAACNPTFNWREVRPDNTALSLLLPCKPDKAEKSVPLGGQPVPLRMLGCDAGDATFAVAVADIGDASKAEAVLAQWQALTLANMKAGPVGLGAGTTQVSSFRPAGMASGAPALLVKSSGKRADGRAVTGQAAYFSRGSQLFQVVLYADVMSAEVAETFFSSLKFEPAS
ncbi:hypothetical protein [Polaromonas eurypsychrophila]|uniref:Transmembrane protein n=1 Tax=Polaromonas eurypsychrophila TaxID=1614635 RepID=A0A916SPD2_9BURK|nr:hypothetical protein [Polaromonas eurypsychrophila]GGB09967.1 hypothetical protein GCM10011496_33610 [Polaromonas eurypsychrophila]